MPPANGTLLARIAVSCLAASICLASSLARAANGPQFVLPSAGVKAVSGLTINFDGRGIDGNGYRPVKVVVTTRPVRPLVADRQIRLVLDFYRYGSNRTSRVSEVIELPEGSSRIEKTILVPQSTSWSMVSVEVHEGGEKLRDLSQEYLPWMNFNGWSWTEARPALLFVDSNVPPRADRAAAVQAFQAAAADATPTYTLPDMRTLLSLFPDISGPGAVRGGAAGAPASAITAATGATTVSDTTLLALLDTRSRVEMLPPAELPDRWIELSQHDAIVVSWTDLKQIAAANRRRLAALRDWVAAGPLLVVYGVGEDFAALRELEKLLELSPLPAREGQPALAGWTAPSASKSWQLDISEPGEAVPDAAAESAAPPGTARATAGREWPGSPPFVHRPAQTGRVVAIAGAMPFPGKIEQWRSLFQAAGEVHWKWFRRTGFSQHQTNNSYWDFLIPGVGKAPAIPFLLLVSLFAVVIGPVNFLVLGRTRRLYLLLLTVPLAALLVTGGLFLFAVLSDGLGLRMRLRSYTDLDQSSGRAVCWSRQSYYASIAPSQGLVFPADAAVFPIRYEPGDRNTLNQPTAVRWDGQQYLTAGYIASRRASQMLVQRATTTKARLIVREGNAAGDPPQITNQLGTNIRYVLLCDRHGRLYAHESLTDGAQATLRAEEPAAARAALVRLSADAKPVAEYDPAQDNESILSLITSRRRYRFSNADAGLGTPAMAQSILESNLAAALDPTKHPPPPGAYTAIVEKSPVVVTGVSGGRQEASLHVVRGSY